MPSEKEKNRRIWERENVGALKEKSICKKKCLTKSTNSFFILNKLFCSLSFVDSSVIHLDKFYKRSQGFSSVKAFSSVNLLTVSWLSEMTQFQHNFDIELFAVSTKPYPGQSFALTYYYVKLSMSTNMIIYYRSLTIVSLISYNSCFSCPEALLPLAEILLSFIYSPVSTTILVFCVSCQLKLFVFTICLKNKR